MRNRLIELLKTVPPLKIISFGGRAQGRHIQTLQNIADHLIANGVVIVDPVKYPPVTNRGIIDQVMGMPLDEMAELINAKKEGRIVIPPCKVGDTAYGVYDIESVHRQILQMEVLRIEIEKTPTVYVKTYRKYIYSYDRFNFDDFGKTVFLTREEAEKALAERKES